MFKLKNSTTLILLCIFISCQSTDLTRESRIDFYGYDFREYAEKGFLFTPEKPLSDYISLGIIELQSRAKIIEINQSQYETYKRNGFITVDSKTYTARLVNNPVIKYYGVEVLDTDVAIEKLYEKAISWGADAVVNFKIETDFETIGNGKIEVPLIRITGLAIDRQ